MLSVFEVPGWRVSLCQTNFRPERRYVEVERSGPDPDPDLEEQRSWCVGFADDPGEAERLFDTTVRMVRLLSTGWTDPVDPGVGPGTLDLM